MKEYLFKPVLYFYHFMFQLHTPISWKVTRLVYFSMCVARNTLEIRLNILMATYGKAWFLLLFFHESWCLKDNPPRLCPRWCNTCPIPPCEFGARLMNEALNWNIWSTSGLPYRPLKLRYFQYVSGRFPKPESNQRLPKELNMKWPVLQTWLIGWHILLEKRPGSNTFHLQLKNKVGTY